MDGLMFPVLASKPMGLVEGLSVDQVIRALDDIHPIRGSSKAGIVSFVESICSNEQAAIDMRRFIHKAFRSEGDIRARWDQRRLERRTGVATGPSRRGGRL